MHIFVFVLASFCLVAYGKPIDGDSLPKRAPDATTTGGATVQTPVQRIFLDTDTCDDGQQKQINQAWQDAGLLAAAAAGGRLDYDYTIPKTHWLGKDWNWPGWWPISSDYRDIINRNIGRQMTLHADNVASGIWIYLSCPKQHDACSPGTIAASADANRIFWKNHYTVFCPLFFNKDSFGKSLDNVRNNVNEQMIMDNYWGNQGYTFFHETYHYGGSVSDPRTGDDCYQAEACWEMAADKYRGTGWAFKTADSYTLEAMAIYAQQYFKTVQPPVPRKYTIALTENNATLYDEAANPSNSTPPETPNDPSTAPPQPTQYYKALDSVPEDLFGTTDNVDAQGTNLDKRWKVMVGPPLGPNPSSCKYTVTSFEGVTSTSFYTLQPTVATMCICDSTVQAGINTVTATAGTSYLVCAVPSQITISTMGPTPTTPPITTTTGSPPVDTGSPQCQNCMNILGASDCGASDVKCLRDQCSGIADCKSCGADYCSTVG